MTLFPNWRRRAKSSGFRPLWSYDFQSHTWLSCAQSFKIFTWNLVCILDTDFEKEINVATYIYENFDCPKLINTNYYSRAFLQHNDLEANQDKARLASLEKTKRKHLGKWCFVFLGRNYYILNFKFNQYKKYNKYIY